MYHSGNQLLDPHLLFAKGHVGPGMHAAVLGCGRTGHLVFPLSLIVGERGVVYAVDILKDVLSGVMKQAQLDGLHNIHMVWADVERVGATAIPERSLDIVFLVNVLIHLRDRAAALAEATRLLQDKGRLVIVDWVDTTAFKLTSRELVDFTAVLSWAGANNLVVQEDFTAGKYHRGIVLYRHE